MAPSMVAFERPRSSSAAWMSCRCFRRDLVKRPIWTVRQMRVDVFGDPVVVCLHGSRVASEARGPDAHPLGQSQSVGRDETLVQLGDELFGGATCCGLGAVDARLPLSVLAIAKRRAPARDLALGVTHGHRRDRAGDAGLGARSTLRPLMAVGGRVGFQEPLDLGWFDNGHRCRQPMRLQTALTDPCRDGARLTWRYAASSGTVQHGCTAMGSRSAVGRSAMTLPGSSRFAPRDARAQQALRLVGRDPHRSGDLDRP